MLHVNVQGSTHNVFYEMNAYLCLGFVKFERLATEDGIRNILGHLNSNLGFTLDT